MWDYIAPFSQGINWLTGGAYTDTFCTRVARNEMEGACPEKFWRCARVALDLLLLPFERHHCYMSLIRTELEYAENRLTGTDLRR